MICDWKAAAQTYQKENWTKESILDWYEKNKNKMILNENTRKLIEQILRSLSSNGWEKVSFSMKYKKGFEWYN